MRAVLEVFFSSVFSFCTTKGYCYWKHNFCRVCVWNPVSGLLQIGQKSGKWQWCHNFPTWCQHPIFLTLFCFSCQVLLLVEVLCQYHHQFWNYDNFLLKGLTRNLEIRNTPIWVSPNIWRLGQVMDTKFGMNVSNRMLVNAAKFQGYSFYTPPPLPPLILGLKEEKWKQQYSCIWQTFRSSHQEELCWKVILKKFIKFSP